MIQCVPRYLFIFGYETPRQRILNAQHGWDDEGSCAFFIDASDEASALRHALNVAEAYVRWLFKRANWEGPIPNWREGDFAHWIERHPERVEAATLGTLPIVSADATPDFENWPVW